MQVASLETHILNVYKERRKYAKYIIHWLNSQLKSRIVQIYTLPHSINRLELIYIIVTHAD